jgi:hypothetical protein
MHVYLRSFINLSAKTLKRLSQSHKARKAKVSHNEIVVVLCAFV